MVRYGRACKACRRGRCACAGPRRRARVPTAHRHERHDRRGDDAMSKAFQPPATISLIEMDAKDTDELALQLFEQQRRETGASFAYCGRCGLAVPRESARRAGKRGVLPICRKCWQLSPTGVRRTTDDRVYLCAVCRTPLHGRREARARYQARRGVSTTCGEPSCARWMAMTSAARGGAANAARPPEALRAASLKTWDKRKRLALECAVCCAPLVDRRRASGRHRRGLPLFCEHHREEEVADTAQRRSRAAMNTTTGAGTSSDREEP